MHLKFHIANEFIIIVSLCCTSKIIKWGILTPKDIKGKLEHRFVLKNFLWLFTYKQ